jgi:hypothetical protein
MLTTLRTGALTLTAVQYKFINGILTIKLTTDGSHKLYGNVNITLANVLDINIYDKDRLLVEDFFNATFLFSRTGATTLEYSVDINSGIAQSADFTTLTNNGSAITATVANASINLGAGNYNFALLDTADSEFSTSTIAIKQLDLGNTGIDGVESVFDELGEGDFLSINGEDLTFDFTAQVSIKDNDAGTTNIPILITSNYGRR